MNEGTQLRLMLILFFVTGWVAGATSAWFLMRYL